MEFTVKDIIREGPCSDNYPLSRVKQLWSGRESLSHREIAALDIPAQDRIWALSRLLFRESPYRAHRVARLIALDVAEFWDCTDIVWWYLTSGDDAAMYAAMYAALDAALDATCGAAKYAARAAALGAALGAALDAAMDAALGAARAAAMYAARAAAMYAALERYIGWICRFGFEV